MKVKQESSSGSVQEPRCEGSEQERERLAASTKWMTMTCRIHIIRNLAAEGGRNKKEEVGKRE